MKQTYTSAGTSVNKYKVPAIFKKTLGRLGPVNLDLGGGKYDTATEFLRAYGVENLILDPYNRSDEHNHDVTARLYEQGADSCTISNVLNVIDKRDARIEAILNAWILLRRGGSLFITVYEGHPDREPGRTGKDQWQNNWPIYSYLGEVRAIFPNARIEGKMIVATKEV